MNAWNEPVQQLTDHSRMKSSVDKPSYPQPWTPPTCWRARRGPGSLEQPRSTTVTSHPPNTVARPCPGPLLSHTSHPIHQRILSVLPPKHIKNVAAAHQLCPQHPSHCDLLLGLTDSALDSSPQQYSLMLKKISMIMCMQWPQSTSSGLQGPMQPYPNTLLNSPSLPSPPLAPLFLKWSLLFFHLLFLASLFFLFF